MKNLVIATVNGTARTEEVTLDTDIREWCNHNLDGYEYVVCGSSRFDIYQNAGNPLHDSNNYFKRN